MEYVTDSMRWYCPEMNRIHEMMADEIISEHDDHQHFCEPCFQTNSDCVCSLVFKLTKVVILMIQ